MYFDHVCDNQAKIITTNSGFTAEVSNEALDDMELFEDLVELDRKNMSVMPRVLERILGSEGKKALYDHCRTEGGRVPMTAVFTEVGEIIGGLKSGKK